MSSPRRCRAYACLSPPLLPHHGLGARKTEGGASCGGAGLSDDCGPPHPPVPKPPGLADPGSPPARPASNARPLAEGAVPRGIASVSVVVAEPPAREQARPAAINKRALHICTSLTGGVRAAASRHTSSLFRQPSVCGTLQRT